MGLENIIGPSSEDREEKPLQPEDIRLAGGAPLYYALMKDPNTLVLKTEDAQNARNLLNDLISQNPERVLECQDKGIEEARRILESIKEEEAAA